MSPLPISHSPDLKQLRDEGYDLEIRSGLLLVKDVPYVNFKKEVKRGTLVAKLDLAGNVTSRPSTHVAYFAGDHPCREDGQEIAQIKHSSSTQTLAEGVTVNHSFSAKPKPSDHYVNYYDQVTTYVAILSGPARVLNANVTAQTFPIVAPDPEETEAVFKYLDTASSRAEINLVTKKLALGNIAIVGLGGTGSYILDFVAKTPVKKIHLYDDDVFLQHNAFRSPGAPTVDELQAKPKKVVHFANIYSKMHAGVVPHDIRISDANVEQLRDMEFVFLCVDSSHVKAQIIQRLEEFGRPFVDVGMGVQLADGALGGILRVTTSTQRQRDHVRGRVNLAVDEGHNEYVNNIQIADLNALNATLAVIKWKKLLGFYRDIDCEHHSTYTIDGNVLINEDRAP